MQARKRKGTGEKIRTEIRDGKDGERPKERGKSEAKIAPMHAISFDDGHRLKTGLGTKQ